MATTHSVKVNGKWHKTGEEIKNVVVEETSLPFSDDDITLEENAEEEKYTKTDINRMSTAELQELADKVGIENAFETSGGELKKLLIEYFGL